MNIDILVENARSINGTGGNVTSAAVGYGLNTK